MPKDFIISTEKLNDRGSRVITVGINTEQFERNPVLFYMHRRGWDGERTPIGRVENLRKEDGKLIGTPVFDMDDEFAAKIARKWENNFLRMCSPGLEPIEFSSEPGLILQGQSRATITKSKLIEVSIVDIGSNDDALAFYSTNGKPLELAAGEDNDLIPLLKTEPTPDETEGINNQQTNLEMSKIFETLGLAATASEDDAVNAITQLQNEAKRAETIELAHIEGAVDAAITAKKTTPDKRDHFIKLGKAAGFEALQSTLDMLTPALKPTDVLNLASGAPASQAAVATSYSEMTSGQLIELRKTNLPEYIQLYKKEFGFEPELGKE